MKLNSCGYYCQFGEGSLSGKLFEVGGESFVLCKDGRVFNEIEQEWITNKNVIKVIKRLASEDEAERERRRQVAASMGATEIEAEAIRLSLQHNDGEVNCVEREGINFYVAGHNASTLYYVGVLDGKRLIGVSYEYEDGESFSYREVQEWGYLGHE